MSDLIKSLNKCRVDGNILYLPLEILSNYAEVKKALMNAGGKYNNNKFVFSSGAQPFIDRLCRGQSINIKREFQFYPTPNTICSELIRLADIIPSHSILEPSAGQGAIVNAIHDKYRTMVVDCCELMPENQQVLSKIPYSTFICDDFLEIGDEWYEQFDRIIANPPFNKNQDISHIRKMYGCLKPGGRMVSIASKHWMNSQNKKESIFRNWLKSVKAEIHDIEAGKFKESGTMVASCIIVINKKS